jgi:large repetitive protein
VGGYRSSKWRLLPLGVTLCLVLTLTAVFASLARAEGTPDISASVSSSSPLYGEPVHVTLDAANPGGQPYGYNLSYRVVLPKGVSYQGGSPVPPTVIANQPAAEETTLIFGNAADLSPSSHRELGFDLDYDQSVWHAGEAIPVTAQAFINTDARFVPKFSPTGQPEGPSSTSYTGFSAEATGEQRLKAIKVTAEEPSPEGEILRGVHEDQTVYTLKVQNNGVNPTTGTKLDAFLPAQLEYLGCGAPGGAGTDNTHNAIATNPGSAEEYPGSGPIKVETLVECQTPELVETEEVDPDGPSGSMPFGVYTHVRWDVGSLTASQVRTFKYRAAIPIRANALAFSGGAKPSGASGLQAANLDNNTGPEVLDEASLPTFATASGTYQGGTPTPTSDETILDRSAEDWVVHKGVEASRLEQGQNVKWTLTFETSEYKYVKEGVVTDTLPNGLCPLGPTNFTHEPRDGADAECDPVSGKEPSAPYTSAVEEADGSWTLTWNAAQFTPAQHTGINDKFTLTFWTHTRTHYQSNFAPSTPVLSRDKITNNVTTEAEGFARCVAPEAKNCENPAAKISHEVPDGTRIVDASSATLEAESPTLEKFVSSGSANCATATYVKAPTVPVYHPGDKVCWKLRITFPGTLDTNAQTIADFLPPGSKYIAGSDEPHGENNVVATLDESSAGSGVLTWTAENATVPAGGQVFERVIATEVAPIGTVVDGDLKGNLLKFSSANTPGESEALRAEADYEITAPVLGLTKGVNKINGTPSGGNGANVDGGSVHEGDLVEYRIDVSNEGGAPAKNVNVRDLLEDGITCANFKAASNGGSCSGSQVDWTFTGTIAPGASQTLTYEVEIPAGVEPGKRIDDHAGIVSYQSETNQAGLFTYIPAENIGGGGAGTPNAPKADDTSFVETPGLAFTKTRTTGVNEAGNNLNEQATIGEAVTYTSKLIVPEGTTLLDGKFLDTLGSERFAELINAETKVNGASGVPAGGAESTNGVSISYEVVFPSAYHNAAGSGDDLIEFIITARVANSAANSRVSPKQTLPNTAHFSWEEEGTTPKETTASVNTEIVEPNIGVAKTDDDPDNRVTPGQIVTYTLTSSNVTGTRVSMAHEVETIDHVPAGLIPVGNAPGNVPLADGAEIPGSGGATWHSASRTIAKKVATIAPGANNAFSYRAEVENPAVAGSTLTNQVEAKASSLPAGEPIRRTSGSGYEAKAEDTVRLVGASIEKTSTPPTATPGNPITYHLKVTIPPSVNLFDTTVRDVLPAGVEFDSYGEIKCLSGCPLVNPVNKYKESINGTTGKETIAWDLGDIPPLGEAQVIELTYAAHLRATNRVLGGNVVKGNTEINAATVGSDLTNKVGPFNENAIPATFDENSPEAKTTTTVVEPQLTLDKQIKVGAGSFGNGPTTAHSNDPLAYRLIVKNEGNSPAYYAEVTDALDPALTNVAVVPQAGVTVTAPWSEGTHAMTLAIAGPIPAGATTTIEYTAAFIAPANFHDGQSVPNTAALPHYFGVPGAERLAHPTWEFRNYAANSDITEAILDFPTFSLTKTTGLAGNPDSGKAEVGQEFPWRIVATNTSATAGAHNVIVTDTLPPNWTYVPGTVKFDGSAGPDPIITIEAGGDKLEWAAPLLPAGSSVTITYGAKPSLAAATTPGTGLEANVNSARIASATDEAGGTGNAEGPYGAGPDTAKATLGLPALTIEKTPDGGAATAGKPSSFTIKVTNTGNATARNLDVKDVLPKGLGYTAGEATGSPAALGSETLAPDSPAAGETTIHWHLSSLAEGATETITVPVFVAADVADGTTLTNSSAVSSDAVTTPVADNGSLLVGAEADMAIEKTGAATYTAGETYTWHLRVKNLGPSDAQGVEVTDPLPAGTTFVSATAPCAASGGEVECALGTAPVGFDQTYDVTVQVDASTTTSPLTNTATVSTTTTDTNPGNDSSTFGPTSGPLADVAVEKTAEPELILKGQQIRFTIRVENFGPSTARAVKLVDPLPAGLEYVAADSPCTQAGGTVTCELGDMEPGPAAARTVHVEVKGVTNGAFTNTATVSTTTPEPAGPAAEENNHSSAPVGVGPVADLAIVKTGPATVVAGGQITWALEVTNNGPDDATGVKAVDTLPAGVQLVSADAGCSAAGGTVTCLVGDLALGESTVRHITVTAPPALGDQTLFNTATVSGDQGDLEPEDNHSEAKTTVGPAADLVITKTGPTKVNAGGDIAWTLVATNNGPSTATGVTVDDALPGGVTLTSSSPSQGSCGGSLSCSLGTLAKGASAQIQVGAHVPASLQGQTLTNSARIAGEQPDPDPGNNSAGASTQVGEPDPADFNLTLAKKLAGPAKPQLGDVLTYTLAVANEGPATARAVRITDTLPGALEYVSASIPGGKCAAAGSVVTCKLASLVAGARKTATLKVRAVAAGSVRNTASVSAEHADAKQADNHDSAVADITAGSADLHLVKKRLGHGPVQAGGTVRFRIEVGNSGVSGAADVVVCDRLPGTMSFVAVKGARFVKGDACWTVAMLAPGKSRGFTVVARIDAGVGAGTVRNVATAEADNAPERSAAAPVKVRSSGPGRGGGVTG